jgi:hypothetical protein
MTFPGSAAVPVFDASLTVISAVGLAVFAYAWLREKGSKGQMVATLLLIVAVLISVPLLADVAEDPCNYCKGLEPWSWEWFKRQCFNCD